MNWKDVAIERLRDYRAKKQALRNIPLEIEEMKSTMTSLRSARPDRIPVKGGGFSHEDKVLSCVVRKEELQRALDRAKLSVDEITGALQILSQEEQLILDRFYINPAKGNVERFCVELYTEQSTVYRRKDVALRKFTIAMYGCLES